MKWNPSSSRPFGPTGADETTSIIALRFFSGWTQQQIADDLGVTQMQVSRLISKALRRLREGLQAA